MDLHEYPSVAHVKNDGNHFVSMISPAEWGGAGPFKKFVAAVKLLADHTWIEL